MVVVRSWYWANSIAPSDQWQVHQRITLRAGLLIPPGTPPGAFDVRVNVVGSSPSTGGDYVTIPGAKVLPCSDKMPCSPPLEGDDLTPLQVTFGNGLTLAGYQPGGLEFFQGKHALVTFYWRPARTLTDDVKERLALVDRSGRVIAQTEGSPVAAWFPSSQWTPGQWLADPQAILDSAQSCRRAIMRFASAWSRPTVGRCPSPRVARRRTIWMWDTFASASDHASCVPGRSRIR